MTAFAVETILDEMAETLGIDPIDMRLRNAVVEGDLATAGTPFPTDRLHRMPWKRYAIIPITRRH